LYVPAPEFFTMFANADGSFEYIPD
jgi:hypothetical protein